MEVIAGDPVNPNNPFWWSLQFRRLLGFETVEEFPDVLESWSGRLHPEDKEGAIQAFGNHLNDYSGQTPYDITFRLKCKNGTYRWCPRAGTDPARCRRPAAACGRGAGGYPCPARAGTHAGSTAGAADPAGADHRQRRRYRLDHSTHRRSDQYPIAQCDHRSRPGGREWARVRGGRQRSAQVGPTRSTTPRGRHASWSIVPRPRMATQHRPLPHSPTPDRPRDRRSNAAAASVPLPGRFPCAGYAGRG